MTAPTDRDRFLARRSPEERLLLLCMRQQLDDGGRERLRALGRGPVDWPAVVAVAVRHQVAPLVLHQLGAAGLVGSLPPQPRAALQRELASNLGAKAALRQALVAALDWFAGEGVAVMAVKGTSLDLRLYDDPALTVSGDVDLLLAAGWDDVDPRVHRRVAALNAGRPVVDVDFGRHPDLVMNGLLAVDFAEIWRQAQPHDVDGRTIHLMCVEHELLCTCIAAARRRYFRLKSLLDVGELLRRSPPDWDEVARGARAWGTAGITWAAVHAARMAVDAPPPPPDLRRRLGLSPPRARLLDHLVGRLSYASLATVHGGLTLRGRRLGRGLLLPYASLGVAALLRGAGIAARQMVRRSYARPDAR